MNSSRSAFIQTRRSVSVIWEEEESTKVEHTCFDDRFVLVVTALFDLGEEVRPTCLSSSSEEAVKSESDE